MKISVALLVLLLAAAWVGSHGLSFHSSKVTCCAKKRFFRGRIPESKIQGYQDTSPTCTNKAVLVTLQRGSACVDPEQRWFQEYLRKQKKPNSTSQ
ncbi:CCL5 protein, partial [Machaerirhynchus nigripectus]|nr:CCL5 protein [Machaerirhynchus nigripectus]